jgi:hypothetical protein
LETENEEPLIVNGRRVSRHLLEARPMRRCRLEECQSHCCTGGVYIHTRQAQEVLAHQDLIKPFLAPERQDASLWFEGDEGPDADYPEGGSGTNTTVFPDPTHPVGQGCVFLMPNRWCALQAAGIANGEDPWRFKPFYCALHPLGTDDETLQLVEQSEMYLDGGNCNRPTEDGALIPIYKLFEPEVKLYVGEVGYEELERIAGRK